MRGGKSNEKSEEVEFEDTERVGQSIEQVS